MQPAQLLQDAGSFILTALPVGGFLAQVTDTIPSNWKDLGVAGCALIASVTLWLYLKKKDNDQKEAQLAALQAKDKEIERLHKDYTEMKNAYVELVERYQHPPK